MSTNAEKLLYVEPMEVLGQLDELGLKEPQLRRAIQLAAQSLNRITKHNPPTAPGFEMWSMGNRFLRDELVPTGWKSSDRSGFPRTIHPLDELAITVTAGTWATGKQEAMPHTRRERAKATVLRSLVDVNSQMQFADLDRKFKRVNKEPSRIPTWFLLHHIDRNRDEVRLELSFPRIVSPKGIVVSFRPRIILKSVMITPDQLTRPIADPAPVDVRVTAKVTSGGA